MSGYFRVGQLPAGGDQDLRGVLPAVGVQHPVSAVVPRRRANFGVEPKRSLDSVVADHILEVRPDFGLRGISARPVGVQCEGELVEVRWDVARGPRIGVRLPHTAEPGVPLEDGDVVIAGAFKHGRGGDAADSSAHHRDGNRLGPVRRHVIPFRSRRLAVLSLRKYLQEAREPDMASPDPMRVGGLGWTRSTKGTLTPRDRRRLLGHVAAGLGDYAAGRLRAATGRVPARAPPLRRHVDTTRLQAGPRGRSRMQRTASVADRPWLPHLDVRLRPRRRRRRRNGHGTFLRRVPAPRLRDRQGRPRRGLHPPQRRASRPVRR